MLEETVFDSATGRITNATFGDYLIPVNALPESAFDLIRARLVLGPLRERLAVLDRLTSALRPGGLLVLEEFTNLEGRGSAFCGRARMATP